MSDIRWEDLSPFAQAAAVAVTMQEVRHVDIPRVLEMAMKLDALRDLLDTPRALVIGSLLDLSGAMLAEEGDDE